MQDSNPTRHERIIFKRLTESDFDTLQIPKMFRSEKSQDFSHYWFSAVEKEYIGFLAQTRKRYIYIIIMCML